ncbi:hypothetical protein HDU76_009299 [Blyttiomyces sp. JEL0837]|nr:hypothetical protein HDU76_009299 [Blyttiomyces sp. JEL0837]
MAAAWQAKDLFVAHREEFLDEILKRAPLGDWWTVHFHSRAEREIRKLRKNRRDLIPVLKNLASVAGGHWTAGVAATLRSESKVVLYECKVLNNLRVVWQVDVAYLEGIGKYSQVIKVWCIGNHQDVVEVVRQVVLCQRAYSPERLRRSEEREILNGIYIPKLWDEDGGESNHVVRLDQIDSTFDARAALDMHEMAVTAKYIPLSKMFLRYLASGVNASSDVEFPFAVSEKESEILHYADSSIICGRSGTGKTSCSVFKLLANLQARRVTHYKQSPTRDAPISEIDIYYDPGRYRQIFVTASPKFCQRVRRYTNQLMQALSPSAMNLEDLDAFLQSIQKLEDEESASPSQDDDAGTEVYDEVERNTGLFDDDLDQYRLPDSFGDLKESDFPLFVHYRKLISMIRVYLGLDNKALEDDGDTEERNLDYEEFAKLFATLGSGMDKREKAEKALIGDKKEKKDVKQGIDASLAFSEIMGIIKGSELATKNDNGFISRDDYLNMSTRAYSTFRESREQMYSLFEAYKSKRLELYPDASDDRAKDEQDRANALNRELAKMIHNKDPRLEALSVNEIYVDEVQDLTMAQILPLITICSNPMQGLMFAGDTAQVITKGSAFRFEDLSSMIHNVLEARGHPGKSIKRFNLTKNYRSHNGILSLAASALDLIHEFFPNVIDLMDREVGTVIGPKPTIILSEGDVKTALSGGRSDGGPIEFGAGQVILVRTLENIAQLKRQLNQEFVLILTIEQAKGMEFRDVLLHDIFSNSPASENKWRLVLTGIENEKAPEFDAQKHNILAAELKLIYTAITRARQRLWIWDSNKKKAAPMLKYWETKSLVATSSDFDWNFGLANASTFEEWFEQGKMLFDNGHYENALFSFKRGLKVAGREGEITKEIHLCEAFMAKRKGVNAKAAGNEVEARREFIKAGESFKLAKEDGRLQSAHIKEAIYCFENANAWGEAAELYMEYPDLKVHASSALSCFRNAKRRDLAGRALEVLSRPREALREYLEDEVYVEQALNVIEKINLNATDKVSPLICKRVAVQAFFTKEIELKQRERALSIVQDPSIRSGLLRSHGMHQDLADYYASVGMHNKAAEVFTWDLEQLEKACLALRKVDPSGILALQLRLSAWWDDMSPSVTFALSPQRIASGENDGFAPTISKTYEFINLFKTVSQQKSKLQESLSSMFDLRWTEMDAAKQFPLTSLDLPIKEIKHLSEQGNVLFLALSSYLHKSRDENVRKDPAGLLTHVERVAGFLQHALLFVHLLKIFRKSAIRTVPNVVPTHTWLAVSKFFPCQKLLVDDSKARLELMQLFGVKYRKTVDNVVVSPSRFEKRAQDFLVSKGVKADSPSRKAICPLKVLYDAADISLADTITGTAFAVCRRLLSSPVMGRICISASLYDGKCFRGSSCQDHHIVAPTFDAEKVRTLELALNFIIAVSGQVIPEVRITFRKEIKALILDRVIQSFDSWDCGHIWTLENQNLVDRLALLPWCMRRLILNHAKKEFADVCDSYNDHSPNRKFPGEKIARIALILKSLEPVNLDERFKRLRNIMPPTFSVIVSDLTTTCTTRRLEEFVRSSFGIFKSIVEREIDWEFGTMQAFFVLLETLVSVLLLTCYERVLLPKRFLKLALKQIDNLFDLRQPSLNKTILFGVSSLITTLLRDNEAQFTDDVKLRLYLCHALLDQRELKREKPEKAPAWFQEEYPLNCVKKLCSTGDNKLVLVWNGEATKEPWTKNALAIAKWHLHITAIVRNPPSANDLDSLLKDASATTVLEDLFVTSTLAESLRLQKANKVEEMKDQGKSAEEDEEEEEEDAGESEAADTDESMPGLASGSETEVQPKKKTQKSQPKAASKLAAKAKPPPKPEETNDDDDIPALMSSSDSDVGSKSKPGNAKSTAKTANKSNGEPTKKAAPKKNVDDDDSDGSLPGLLSASGSDDNEPSREKGGQKKEKPGSKSDTKEKPSSKSDSSKKPQEDESGDDDIPDLVSASNSDSDSPRPKAKPVEKNTPVAKDKGKADDSSSKKDSAKKDSTDESASKGGGKPKKVYSRMEAASMIGKWWSNRRKLSRDGDGAAKGRDMREIIQAHSQSWPNEQYRQFYLSEALPEYIRLQKELAKLDSKDQDTRAKILSRGLSDEAYGEYINVMKIREELLSILDELDPFQVKHEKNRLENLQDLVEKAKVEPTRMKDTGDGKWKKILMAEASKQL